MKITYLGSLEGIVRIQGRQPRIFKCPQAHVHITNPIFSVFPLGSIKNE